MEHEAGSELEKDLVYLGLLDKAHEIYTELGGRAVLSYIKSSYQLLSKVYHPDLNPGNSQKAEITQKTLNRVNNTISRMTDKELLAIIKRGMHKDRSSKRKILVVEDEPELQFFFQQILIMEGYDARIAEDGIRGYEAYCRFKPDLMLCDLIMPRMGGLELVKKIRKTTPKIKVIYMSGFFDIAPFKGTFDDEVTRYGYHTLAKPFRASELLLLIRNYLNEDLGELSEVDTLA
ncbi:MAG: response regulator [Desulfobacterales bacterium]|nr:response regulator [Desulfobacterales bacterium]